jgi:transketolase
VAHGGLGAMLSQWILESGVSLSGYEHLYARGYPSQRYGSQAYHRRDSGLDPDSIRRALLRMGQQ